MSGNRPAKAAIAAKARIEKIDDEVELHSTELPFCDSTDLLADLLSIVAPSAGAYGEGVANTGDALGRIAQEVVGGRLTKYLVRVLAGTTMVVRGVGKWDLDSREKLDAAFTGRKKYIFVAVKLALEVSFKDFLDGLALAGIDMSKLTAMVKGTSSSETSSPSTEGTG